MRRPGRSRMRQPRLSFRGRVLLSMGALVVPLGFFKAIGVDFGTSLGVAGTVFGVATFLMGEYRRRDTPPRKKVVYVSQSDTRFNANVLDGFREILSNAFPNDLSIRKPEHSDLSRLAKWQVEILLSTEAQEASAIVIVPPHGEPDIWEQLAARMRDGVFVVVVDVRPDGRCFMQHGLSPPSFVSSDFVEGGKAVGRLILSRSQVS
jgi:ABC-type sugar transport system substrate-binding protein